ncbi:fumarate hydratase [Fusibacter bizertensis]|uniref:Fumarate hydratase n=1 Tax=Fusibacter bizertensis TaxID=1488331 RepID=A0ABT6NGW2_9FIRM|nr:fumarate hydratase [Fusibacter bizertensis]MDH8679651.1 fumarate hydratase [Fusibacter bizertensis]
MKRISVNAIIQAVKEACITMNYEIDPLISEAFENAKKVEKSPVGISIIEDLIKNAEIAQKYTAPICQDTGMIVAFVTLGQNVLVEDGAISDAINEGVRQGYAEGYLRKSVVSDPVLRKNSGDNTPAVIYFDVVEGDVFEIELASKGFGSENMSKSKMLKPSDGMSGIMNFVIETVKMAGPNPCPPIVVGIGIGGTIDKAAQIAKKSLLRPLGQKNELPHIAQMEEELLEEINHLGIGPQGLGGITTALAVHAETYPTHIAGLPVVVNINCHASRHKKVVL